MSSKRSHQESRLEEKFRSNPRSLSFSRIADTYRKSGNIDEAVSLCKTGLENNPDYITGHIILGRCYLEQEKFTDAIESFTNVCRLDRRNQIAIKMLADIFSKQGSKEKAGNLYSILSKIDPENLSFAHLCSVFKGSAAISDLYSILELPIPTSAFSGASGQSPTPQMQDAVAHEETLYQEQSEVTQDADINQILDTSLQDKMEPFGSDAGAVPTLRQEADEMIESIGAAGEGGDTPGERTVFGEDASADLSDDEPGPEFSKLVTSLDAGKDSTTQNDGISIPQASDVASRIDSLFADEKAPDESSPIADLAESLDVVTDQPALSTSDVGDLMIQPGDEAGVVDEASSRLMELFPEEGMAAAQPLSQEFRGELFQEPSAETAPADSLQIALEPQQEPLPAAMAGEPLATIQTDDAAQEFHLENIADQSSEFDSMVAEMVRDLEQEQGGGTDAAFELPEDFDVADSVDRVARSSPDMKATQRIEIIPKDPSFPAKPVSKDSRPPKSRTSELPDELSEVTAVFDVNDIAKALRGDDDVDDGFIYKEVDALAPAENLLQGTITGDEVVSRLDEMFAKPQPPTSPEVAAPKTTPSPDSDSDTVTGEDIVSRLNEMFTESDDDSGTAADSHATQQDVGDGQLFIQGENTQPEPGQMSGLEQFPAGLVLEGSEIAMEQATTAFQTDGDTTTSSPLAGEVAESLESLLSNEQALEAATLEIVPSDPDEKDSESEPEQSLDRLLETAFESKAKSGPESEPESGPESEPESEPESGPEFDVMSALESESEPESNMASALESDMRLEPAANLTLDIDTPIGDAEALNILSIDAIPDDEMSTFEGGGDFYTETGENIVGDADDEPPKLQVIAEEYTGSDKELFPVDHLDRQDDLETDTVSEEESVVKKTTANLFTGSQNMVSTDDSQPAHDHHDIVVDQSAEPVGLSEEDVSEVVPEEIATEIPPVKKTKTKPKPNIEDENLIGTSPIPELRLEESHDGSKKKKNKLPPRPEKEIKKEFNLSIPDHVMTPTLAYIYQEQGQPYIALHIYKKLLERTPDNQKLKDGIAVVEKMIRQKEAQAASHATAHTTQPKDEEAKGKAGTKSASRKSAGSKSAHPQKETKKTKKPKDKPGE